jgi:hypothetical protein
MTEETTENHNKEPAGFLDRMDANIKKLCSQVNELHQEILGPPGQPGLKGKVESQGTQIKHQWTLLCLVGAALLGSLAKVLFF